MTRSFLARVVVAAVALLLLVDVPALADTTDPIAIASTAEGGTDGTAVTAANSGGGSGDPWDFVTKSTNTNAFVYRATTAMKGATAYDLTTAGTGQAYLAWWFWDQNGRGTQPVLFTRFYARFPSAPSGNVRLYRLRNPSGTDMLSLFLVASTRRLQLRDASNAIRWTSAAALPVDAPFRVEVRWDRLAGEAEVRLYLSDPDAPLETFSESSGVVSGNFGVENADEAAYGAAGSNTNFGRLLLDDLAIATQDWVGPSV